MTSREPMPSIVLISLLAIIAAQASMAEDAGSDTPDTDDWSGLITGEGVYLAACATCHGLDGTGSPQNVRGFDVEMPDFTDCSFASREPQADWFAIAHNGGPTRGFDRKMPAFGGAITDGQLDMAAAYVKDFCEDKDWPDGTFNIPRALVTGKAFVEDELVFELGSTFEEPVDIQLKVVFEKRIGKMNQVELFLPVGVKQVETIDDSGNANFRWGEGLGDLGLAWKGVLWHSLRLGTIGSLGADVFFPLGDEEDGFSKGVFRFEPFLAVAQILPADNFIQLQGGAELSADPDVANHEIFWRAAVGHSFTQGHFGRTWSPMVEVLGTYEVESDSEAEWALVPELHVTLNTRQHVMLVFGAEIPVTHFDERQIQGMIHLLWDWYDGAFTDGW